LIAGGADFLVKSSRAEPLRDRCKFCVCCSPRTAPCTSLTIPVLVTGIQYDQVLDRGRLFKGFIHGADAPWLEPCDEHRDEGASILRAHPLHEKCPRSSRGHQLRGFVVVIRRRGDGRRERPRQAGSARSAGPGGPPRSRVSSWRRRFPPPWRRSAGSRCRSG
jgi:hypothetical protein